MLHSQHRHRRVLGFDQDMNVNMDQKEHGNGRLLHVLICYKNKKSINSNKKHYNVETRKNNIIL